MNMRSIKTSLKLLIKICFSRYIFARRDLATHFRFWLHKSTGNSNIWLGLLLLLRYYKRAYKIVSLEMMTSNFLNCDNWFDYVDQWIKQLINEWRAVHFAFWEEDVHSIWIIPCTFDLQSITFKLLKMNLLPKRMLFLLPFCKRYARTWG